MLGINHYTYKIKHPKLNKDIREYVKKIGY